MAGMAVALPTKNIEQRNKLCTVSFCPQRGDEQRDVLVEAKYQSISLYRLSFKVQNFLVPGKSKAMGLPFAHVSLKKRPQSRWAVVVEA